MHPTPTEGTAATRRAAPQTTRDAHLARVYATYPLEVASAEGVWLHTIDGRKVLDLYGGHAVAALGYGHPRWIRALETQARAVGFQSNAVAMQVRERAAARLVRFADVGLETVFFVNSGAEANENALRVALKATGRAQVVALEHAFHGRTAAAGAVTWGAREKWYAFPRTPFDVSFIPRQARDAIREQVSPLTAAVIVEPIQGVAGAFDLGGPFLAALRQRCDEVGALLIFDEVQCGMGRCGASFAAKLHGVRPDLLTTAKSLGAGFPCAALLMSDELARSLRVEDLGTTFGGGPLACALMETVIDVIESEDLLAQVRRVAAYLHATCAVGPVLGFQGAGFLLGLRTSRPAREVQQRLLERGVLAGTSADPHVVRLLPPFILEETHVDLLRRALEDIGR